MSESRRIRLRRTLDHLTRRHAWLGDVLRNRRLAKVLALSYCALLLLIAYQIFSASAQGGLELLKSFSPVFFDLALIFTITVMFLFWRTYYADEQHRIDRSKLPDERFFISLSADHISVSLNESLHERHPAVAAILSALPMDLDEYFNVHAGALDVPKLTLRELHKDATGNLQIRLGVASFREFFFTHHFPDFVLSRNGSRDIGHSESLRSLFSPVYERVYRRFFSGESSTLRLLNYTPNTLGITGLVCIQHEQDQLFVMQVRGQHESAAKGVVQLTYAGTINAFPDFMQNPAFTLTDLIDDEFRDEFAGSSLGVVLGKLPADHQIVGFCCNSQYLFQPELFAFTRLQVADAAVMRSLRINYAHTSSGKFFVVNSVEELLAMDVRGQISLRPLCRQAMRSEFYANLST